MESLRSQLALLPTQEHVLRSAADALALAVHATLELDGAYAIYVFPPLCPFRVLLPATAKGAGLDSQNIIWACEGCAPLRVLCALCVVLCRVTSRVACVCAATGLRCIASSEAAAKSFKGECPATSGPLPADWNESDDVYCLYYKHASSPGALFTVKSIVMDDTLLVAFVTLLWFNSLLLLHAALLAGAALQIWRFRGAAMLAKMQFTTGARGVGSCCRRSLCRAPVGRFRAVCAQGEGRLP